jgi:hypothetical protein
VTEQTFTISIIEKNRKVRVSYTRDGLYHVYTSPDVNGCKFFSSSKTKAYEGFVRQLKEML